MATPLHYRVPPSLAGQRLDRVLEALCRERTRAQLQKLVRRGQVRLDGRRVRRSNVTVGGQAEIQIQLEAPQPAAEPAVEVLHEDEHLVVVHKPAGLLTHPAPRSEAPDVAGALSERYGPLPTLLGEERPGIVHRLDRETSGALVVARTSEAMQGLRELFRRQAVEKIYAALVSGRPPTEPFEVDAALEPVPGKLDRQRIARGPGGKAALTRMRTVEAFANHALVHCRPKSGRRHQIRVHLASLSLPVVGDKLYGTKQHRPLPGGLRPKRQALHALGLAFRHPIDGTQVNCEAPLPGDFASILNALRAG